MTILKRLQLVSTSRICVALAVFYAIIAYGCLQLSFVGTNASPVWPLSGLAFTAVWFLGYRIWPGIWMGAFIANIAVFLSHGWTITPALFVSVLIGIGNSMEALFGVFLLRSFIEETVLLSKIGDIFKFVFAVLVACLPSATIGTSAVFFIHPAPGVSFDMIWFTWWLGDVVGILIIASLFLTFHKKLWQISSWQNVLEAILVGFVLIAVNAGIFMGKFPEYGFYSHVTYLVLPFAIWATYRFGFPGATLSILTTSVLAVCGSLLHLGPFIGDRVPEDLVIVQCFIGVIAVTVLTLAAALYERLKAEEDIKYSEARFRSLVENSFEVVGMVNAQGKVLYASPPTKSILGHDNSDAMGLSMYAWMHPEDIPRIREIFKELLKTPGAIVHATCRLRRKDGIWRWMEGSGHNLLHDPAIKSIVINYRDITERRMAEEILKRDKESLERLVDERSKELIKTQKELKQFSRLADIGTLAATVAHELRNPLGVIHLAAYNLKREKAELIDNRHLTNIEKKVWEGNQIIDNLLSYARIKIPNYENVHILNILDECLASAQGRFAEKGIVIEKHYGDSLDIIEADSNQIREIFLNILNNACQAFAAPGGRVELKAVRDGHMGDMVKVTVQDAGGGIAPEDLDKIFEPFFTRKSKGTGLGMTICNELVNLYHGKIEIASKLGEGTTVSVFLPIHRRDHVETASH
jgi:PAS domain S-box-containing protein